jgi:hypothetical protein
LGEAGGIGTVEGVPGRYFFEPLDSTVSSTQTILSQDTVTCTGTLPSRLIVGGHGRVLPGTANNVRPEVGTDNDRIGQIPGGGEFLVLEGPICTEGYSWWRVDYNGLIGWTAEADSEDYWLEPLN